MSRRFISFLALTVLVAAPLAAQPRGSRAPDRPGPDRAETALRLRERLQLSDEQLKSLRALREENLATRRADLAAMMDLRSKLRAGEIAPEAFRTQARAQREAIRTRLADRGDRVGGILNDTQRGQLQQFQRQQLRRHLRQGNDRGPRMRMDRGDRGRRMHPDRGGRRPGDGPRLRRPGPAGEGGADPIDNV